MDLPIYFILTMLKYVLGKHQKMLTTVVVTVHLRLES